MARSTKREFPDHPLVGVGGVAIKGERVLLVQRNRAPLKGRWTIPGGLVELGETLRGALKREMKEETGLNVRVLDQLAVLDRIYRKGRRVRFHYVIVDFLCRAHGGKMKASSDVRAARWVEVCDLPKYRVAPGAMTVIRHAFEAMNKRRPII